MKLPLCNDDVGRWVVYTDATGEQEKGRIKSFNSRYIFVVYKCDNQWDRFLDFTGCATDPEDLVFVDLKEKLKNGKMMFETTNIATIIL